METDNGRSAPAIVADSVPGENRGTAQAGARDRSHKPTITFWLGVFVGAVVAFVAGTE
jgi:hypothetical protein